MEQGKKEQKTPIHFSLRQSTVFRTAKSPFIETISIPYCLERLEWKNALQICETNNDSTGTAKPLETKKPGTKAKRKCIFNSRFRFRFRCRSQCTYLNDPAVTGIATCRLRLANNLDNLTTAQTEVPSNGVRNLYAGKL